MKVLLGLLDQYKTEQRRILIFSQVRRLLSLISRCSYANNSSRKFSIYWRRSWSTKVLNISS